MFDLTTEHEAADRWYESRQKWIERECSNQAAIHELNDTGKHDVKQVGVNQFQFLWRIINVFIVEFVKNCCKIRHFFLMILFLFKYRKKTEMRKNMDDATRMNTRLKWQKKNSQMDTSKHILSDCQSVAIFHHQSNRSNDSWKTFKKCKLLPFKERMFYSTIIMHDCKQIFLSADILFYFS